MTIAGIINKLIIREDLNIIDKTDGKIMKQMQKKYNDYNYK